MKLFAKIAVLLLSLCASFTASAQTASTSPNYSGMWWAGEAESGWGMTLAHHKNASGDNMFGALFIYGQDGKPTWLVASGGVFSENDTKFVGDLYTVTGPSYRNPVFNTAQVSPAIQVGQLTLTFVDSKHALMVYTVNGLTVTKMVEHFDFYAPPYDQWPNDFSDMWWNPAESGWGFNIAQGSDQLFGVLYGYREDGSATWFVMSGGSWTTPRSFSGNVFTTTGPSYTNPVFNPGNVARTSVGSLTLLFNNRNSATLSYTFNCVSKTTNIERLPFIANEGVGATMFSPSKLSAFVLAAGIAGCGDGGGGSSSPSVGPAAATVAVTGVTPANGATNVSIDTKPTLTFTVANGSYLSHTADFRCGGIPVSFTSSNPGNVSSGTITLTPSTNLPLGQTCQITWSVSGTPQGNGDTKWTQTFNVVNQSVPAKLLLSIADPSVNGNQSVMVIDLTTGNLSSAGIPRSTSLGCEFGNLTTSNVVRIACTVGANHWDYNPVTNVATQTTTLSALPSSTRTPVVSSPSGLDYYGVGGNQGGGQVMVRNGNSFPSAWNISTASLQYVAKVLGDFPSGKLYTLNQNLNQVNNPATIPARVDRINATTGTVEATYTDTVPGVGLALYNGELYMALQRRGGAVDVVKFNASTMTKAGEGSTTIFNSSLQSVYDIAVDANGVHLGVLGGVQTLSHDLKSVLRTSTTLGTSVATSIVVYNGKLYVTLSNQNTDNVVELDSASLSLLRKWSIAGSPVKGAVVGN